MMRPILCWATFVRRRIPFVKNTRKATTRKNIFISLILIYDAVETITNKHERPIITMDENTTISSMLTPLSLLVGGIKNFVFDVCLICFDVCQIFFISNNKSLVLYNI